MLGMVITKRVSVTEHYINSRPSVQAWRGIALRVSCISVADGEKTDSGSSLIRRDGSVFA